MEKKRFNQNWYFWKDGCEHQKQAVILPHDAMILEDRQPDMENGSASGYFPGGKYWYSKTFFGGEEFRDQTAVLEFEGVYMNATVWLNREKVGGWIYGYTNFLVDITDRICLHGTSSVSNDQIGKLFEDGICKVNIWTALERDASPALTEWTVKNAAKCAGPRMEQKLIDEGYLTASSKTGEKASLQYFTTTARQAIVFEEMKKIARGYLELWYRP